MSRPKEIDVWFSLPAPLLWQIEAPLLDFPLSQLTHNLDICYWEKEGTDDWNLTPRACLADPKKEITHFQLIEKADLQFPLILYQHQKQWIILDGVHRFAKAWKERKKSILVKCLTFEQISPLLTEKEEPCFLLQKAPFPFSEKMMKSDFSSLFLKNLEKQNHFPAKLYKNFFLKHTYRLSEAELLKSNAQHQRNSGFFSASYSWDWLFLGISKEKIGVDVEQIKPRDESLLKTHENELKTHFWTVDRKGFYLLRTAKEVILKASATNNLDHIAEIKLLSSQKKNQMIWNLAFTWELRFSFQERIWKVWSFEDGEKAYSLTILPKKKKVRIPKFCFMLSWICFLIPIFFYRLLHGKYERYLWIIHQDFPFSHFGSGPFQFWFLIALPFLFALCFWIIAYLLRKRSSPKADESVLTP